MTKYFASRLLAMVPTLLLLVMVVVVLIRLLPGDAVDIMLQENRSNQKLDRQQIEQRLGLDRSLPSQYARYVLNLSRGSLGDSLWNHQPVMEVVGKRLPVTIELTMYSMIVGCVVGMGVGIL